jgi:hypothetical protein
MWFHVNPEDSMDELEFSIIAHWWGHENSSDCIPVCTMTWSGPNLPSGTTSVLNLQSINRNQAGNYQCTASNDVSSNTSVVVNVVVQWEISEYRGYNIV